MNGADVSSGRYRLLAQLAATGGGEAAARVAQLLTVALLAKTIGVVGLGVVGLAWSLTNLVTAVAQGGPELAGLRLLGLGERAGVSPARVVAETTALKLRLAVAAVPLLFAVQWLLGHSDRTALLQLAAQAGATILVARGYAWAFRGVCRPGDLVLVRALQPVGGLAILWLLLMVWPSPLAAPVAEGAAAVLAVAVARRRLGRLAGPEAGRGWTAAMTPGLAGAALMLGAINMAGIAGWMSPILAAARWASIADVSYLTATLRLLIGAVGVMQVGFQAIYPMLARRSAVETAAAEVTAALSVQGAVAATVLVGIILLTADDLVVVLMGKDFAVAGALLAALSPILVPVALSSPLTYALLARGETAVTARIAVGAAVATAVACVAAFQIIDGPWGVMVLHGALWGQVIAIFIVARRYRVVAMPVEGWRVLFDVRRLVRGLSAAANEIVDESKSLYAGRDAE